MLHLLFGSFNHQLIYYSIFLIQTIFTIFYSKVNFSSFHDSWIQTIILCKRNRRNSIFLFQSHHVYNLYVWSYCLNFIIFFHIRFVDDLKSTTKQTEKLLIRFYCLILFCFLTLATYRSTKYSFSYSYSWNHYYHHIIISLLILSINTQTHTHTVQKTPGRILPKKLLENSNWKTWQTWMVPFFDFFILHIRSFIHYWMGSGWLCLGFLFIVFFRLFVFLPCLIIKSFSCWYCQSIFLFKNNSNNKFVFPVKQTFRIRGYF